MVAVSFARSPMVPVSLHVHRMQSALQARARWHASLQNRPSMSTL